MISINVVMLVFCLIMVVLSLAGIWKANKGGVASLWLLLGITIYMLGEVTDSYKAVVLLLNR